MNEQEIKIESGIPLPKKEFASPTPILKKMQPGDSVVIRKSQVQNWRSCARAINRTVSVRKISPTESRLWVV